MRTADPTPVRQAVDTWVATGKSPPYFAIFLSAAGTLLATIGGSHKTTTDWVLLIGGVCVGVAGLVLQSRREEGRQRIAEAQENEADRFFVAMQDAFQPVAELIAGMPSMSKADRIATHGKVCEQAVGALRLLLRDVDRLRAVVYELNEAADTMSCAAYHGRGERPRPFEKGTERGDRALEMVRESGNLFVRDLDTETVPVDYKGSGAGYRTFISATISTGENAFGMVTVDAPRAGDLVETDQQIVMLMADLLAIAFSEAAR